MAITSNNTRGNIQPEIWKHNFSNKTNSGIQTKLKDYKINLKLNTTGLASL